MYLTGSRQYRRTFSQDLNISRRGNMNTVRQRQAMKLGGTFHRGVMVPTTTRGNGCFGSAQHLALAPPPFRHRRSYFGIIDRMNAFGLCAGRCGPLRAATRRTRARFLLWGLRSFFSKNTNCRPEARFPAAGRPESHDSFWRMHRRHGWRRDLRQDPAPRRSVSF